MLAPAIVELNDVSISLLLLREHLCACKGQHGAIRTPLHLGDLHQRVDQYGLLVPLVLHDLRAAILVGNRKRGAVLLMVPLSPVVPM